MPVSIEIVSDWTIKVTCGVSVMIEVPRPRIYQVVDEEYASLPVYKDNALGYDRGERLKAVRTGGGTTTDLLHPSSVRIKPVAGSVEPFVPGRDYQMDYVWATFGRVENGTISEGQSVFVDYNYTPCRLDSIVQDSQGQIKFVEGTYGIGLIPLPQIASDEVLLARLWLNGPIERLTQEHLFPVLPSALGSNSVSVAQELLPKTLKKLSQGQPLKIIAWGDSVTEGGDIGQPGYQHIFVDRLKQRFPNSRITLRTAGWPGATSQNYIDAPAGGKYDFIRDCLDPRPDLVTIEFVNDATFFNEEETLTQYAKILQHFMIIGAEVILIAPHYIRPDWMNAKTLKIDDDPRPYVKGLRRFAREHRVALADTPKYWANLYRQGIPYMIYMLNGINHPDIRGHHLFVDALMELFPRI